MQNNAEQKKPEASNFRRSKVLRIITSGLLAFCLWFYVISVERTETEQEFTGVEVVLDGEAALEDSDLKIISDKDMKVKIKLNGRRSVLNKLRSSDITVRVDLTRIHEPGTKNLPYEIEFPGDIQSSSIEVVSRNPDAITLTVVSWTTKRVDLRNPEIVGAPAQGYRVGTAITQSDEKVSLSGPKEIIDQIHTAGVVVDVDGVTETQNVRMSFCYYDEDGNQIENTDAITANPDKTSVVVPILKEKDNVKMQWPLSFGAEAEDKEFTLNVSVTMADQNTSTYSGVVLIEHGTPIFNGEPLRQTEDGKLYFDLGTITAFGKVEYVTEAELPMLELTDKFESTYTREDIDLQQDGVSCDVESVTVSVTTRKKVIKTVSGVNVQNLPKGATSTPLVIQLKGFEEDFVGVDKSDIRAVLESVPTVSGTYDVTVTIDAHPEISVVEDYQVEIKFPSVTPTIDYLSAGNDNPHQL